MYLLLLPVSYYQLHVYIKILVGRYKIACFVSQFRFWTLDGKSYTTNYTHK